MLPGAAELFVLLHLLLLRAAPNPFSALPVPVAWCCLIPGAGPLLSCMGFSQVHLLVPWLASLPLVCHLPCTAWCGWLWMPVRSLPCRCVHVSSSFIPCAMWFCIIIEAGLLMKLTYRLELLEFPCAVFHKLCSWSAIPSQGLGIYRWKCHQTGGSWMDWGSPPFQNSVSL